MEVEAQLSDLIISVINSTTWPPPTHPSRATLFPVLRSAQGFLCQLVFAGPPSCCSTLRGSSSRPLGHRSVFLHSCPPMAQFRPSRWAPPIRWNSHEDLSFFLSMKIDFCCIFYFLNVIYVLIQLVYIGVCRSARHKQPNSSWGCYFTS
jgi:hypothetical protein